MNRCIPRWSRAVAVLSILASAVLLAPSANEAFAQPAQSPAPDSIQQRNASQPSPSTQPVINRRANGTPIVTSQNFRDIDYAAELVALAERAQPMGAADGDNAWDAYIEACVILLESQRAFDKSKNKTDPDDMIDFDSVSKPESFDDSRLAAQESRQRQHTLAFMRSSGLAKLDPLLAKVRASPRLVRPPLGREQHNRDCDRFVQDPTIERTDALVTACMHDVGMAKALTRLSLARLKLATEARDWKQAALHAETAFALARAHVRQPYLSAYIAGCGMAVTTVEQVLACAPTTDAQAAYFEACAAALDRQLSDLPGHQLAIEGERLIMMDLTRSMFKLDGSIHPGAAKALPQQPDPDEPTAPSIWPTPAWTINRFNAIFDDHVSHHEKPFARQNPDELLSNHVNHDDPREAFIAIAPATLLQAADLERRVVAMTSGLRAIAAVETFHERQHRWPRSWDEIKQAGIACEVPDPFTGESLHLIPGPEKSRRRSYVIYSIGADLEDQGGKPDPQSPMNAFRRGEHRPNGSDYVFAAPSK